MTLFGAKRTLSFAAALALTAALIGGCSNTGNVSQGGADETGENSGASIAEVVTMTGRTTENFDKDWKFLKMTQKDGLSELSVETADFDDSAWENITLPHTWNDKDGCDGWSGVDEGGENYYRGLGGYRKSYYFSSEAYSEKSVYLEFEGANTVTELFVNGTSAGIHKGGYSAFRFNITDLIRLDEENIIAVKVNNAPTEYIAPINIQGDFTKMGGIYRDVSLIAVSPVHIDLMDYGSSGVYVTPKNITSGSADIDVAVKLANETDAEQEILIKTDIIDGSGGTACSSESSKTLSANANDSEEISMRLTDPILWNGTKDPYLYTAKITLSRGETVLDEYSQSFGIRSYRIDPDDGFFLNGEYLDLRGVCYHQDSYENGWAMTNEQRERDYAMMLDMGCNSVRMAHYQHDGYEYDLCDKLGITVWTEIGLVNKMSGDETDALAIADGFVENTKQQLTELIRQNYNHPSVIVWGISNELYQMSDEIFDIYTELNALANAEDETRLITFADAQFWGKFLELPADVVGYNRYFGWYKDAGRVEKFGPWLDDYHQNREERPICVSEYGGGAAVSQHKDNIDWRVDIDPWGERHYENYQSQMHEQIWAQFSERQYLWAKYIWCMFDFASDGRQEGDTKGQNDKGLVTRERVEKDAFYFYKSVWNDELMLHITEKRFTNRPSEVPLVKVYSNADKVELFVNGSSRGTVERQTLDPLYSTVFTWENISLEIGSENEIKAVAYLSDGSALEDTAVWTGEPVEDDDTENNENIALNKPVVYASSEEAGNPASGINDGITDEGSRWCAASADDYPASVIIDLEKTYGISKVTVAAHKPGVRAYQFTVSVSNTQDGDYTVISDHSENTDNSGYYADELENPITGRFLKIEVTGCSDSTAFPCIWELEAYGAEM
ncbi:MAG: discoidin domain-containing protein [Lachnospiraceae bacterium]|nr:discoidin domain-containing protein [Ruminococcus sp.]MCM1275654.1 discoidin domain-containing protein [Lachnospiraceae bacterium]